MGDSYLLQCLIHMLFTKEPLPVGYELYNHHPCTSTYELTKPCM